MFKCCTWSIEISEGVERGVKVTLKLTFHFVHIRFYFYNKPFTTGSLVG